jgi:hypothetical protein
MAIFVGINSLIMPIHAVLTGDIVNSTKLERATEKKLFKALQRVLSPYPFEFYRGDSFQVYIKDPAKSLRIALLCRTVAISMTRKQTAPSDVRVSLGIGKVFSPVINLHSAKGEAFILSGRAFDTIQPTRSRLSIVTANPLANTGLQVMADYINSMYEKMTAKQAEVIFELLQDKTQEKIGVGLKKSTSTVNQLAGAGKWPEIKKTLQHFENLIKQLI